MNGVNLPKHIVDRVIQRRGTEHPFADLDPARTALVVIDMQRWFMDETVGQNPCAAAREAVPAVNRLTQAVRDAGGGVFWVLNTHNERNAREWSVMEDMATPARRALRAAGMSEGTAGHELWPGLVTHPADEMVRKYRYSAFLPGASDLPDRLRARGFDTVLITGTVTNVCCESSARDAMMTNFRVVMVSDANGAQTQEEHDASLIALYSSFTDLMDTDMIIARLQAARLEAKGVKRAA